MIRCPVCNHEEYEGTLYCAECGNQLWEGVPRPADDDGTATTQRFGAADLAGPPANDLGGPLPGSAPIGTQPNQIIIRLAGENRPIYLSGRDEYRLGRGDPRQSIVPELDLGPYRALELGVSRFHAVLKHSGQAVTLTDLGSTNGTTVNGMRLTPNAPQPLRDGDELRLGKLSLRIFFS